MTKAKMIIIDPLIRIVDMILQLYVWAIIISAILSWLVHFDVVNRRNPLVNSIGTFLWRITEPALRPIRRFVPAFGGVDISPIVLILAIYFLQMVLANIHRSLVLGY
ncbi:MAG TPA: YggT family protein [Kiloniellaceae bacterium]|nr:YggT family protein [Kiloniellaceae bacterium]